MRKTVHFFGNVQGVGFRYTARSIANDFDVDGYVRNLRNGSVELVAEGNGEVIARFLQTLRERMSGYIEREEAAESLEMGLIGGFEIRH